jgi:hypothetical protein
MPAAMSLSLPLTAMEEFFFWDDRPAYPCSSFVRLRFSGCLDRAAFQRAVDTALSRHPLLTAKVEIAGRRRLRWSLVENPAPVIVWEERPLDGRLPPATHLDLRREIGIRFHVRIDPVAAASDLTIQIHHACCDAAGIASFIRDLLVVYAAVTTVGQTFLSAEERARATAGLPIPGATAGLPSSVADTAGQTGSGTQTLEQMQLPPLDPALLAGRGRFGLSFGKLLAMAPRQLVGLLGARQFLMRRPAPVIPHQASPNDSPLPREYPATLSHAFDRETTAAVRRAATRQGVTPNDLLARDLFLALAEWRRRQNVADDDGWLRMMVPINLRTAADRRLPAAVVVGSVFLDRRGPDFADPDRLLRGIHAEMELIKRNRLGFTFVFSLAVCRRLLGGLEKKVRADKCTVSCVFTNVGTLFAEAPLPERDGRIMAGNLTLVDLDTVAPIHPYSCVTMIAGLYAGRLSITLHYDPRPLSQAQAADLLDVYARRIGVSIA